MSTEEEKDSVVAKVTVLIIAVVALLYIIIRIFSDSVLHFAVEHDLCLLADTALICQAQADAADDNGEFPIIKAAKKGSLGCLKSLNPRVSGYNAYKDLKFPGDPPKYKSKKSLILGLSSWIVYNMMGSCSRADIDKKDADGNTALHWAAIGGHYGCVEYLLECGADTEMLNNKGRTPKDEAAANGYRLCANLIEKNPNNRERPRDRYKPNSLPQLEYMPPIYYPNQPNNLFPFPLPDK